MDTRNRGRQEDGSTPPEPSTDTVGAELVELQSVGSSGGGVGPKAIAALGVLGVLAFVSLMATSRPANAVPSPSAAQLAAASAGASTPVPTATSSATPAPATAPPTPRVTAPPPWQWRKQPLLPDLDQSVRGMWGVNENILILVDDAQAGTSAPGRSSIVRLSPGRARAEFAAPPAILEFQGGSVVDGRLVFLAKVGGVGTGEVTWQLVSTADGETWESPGAIYSLPPFDGVSFVGRAGEAWVLATWYYSDTGPTPALSWSTDGLEWFDAELPARDVPSAIFEAATLNGTMVVRGEQLDGEGDVSPLVLTSTDGRSWAKSAFTAPQSSIPEELACNDETCVITVHTFQALTPPGPRVMVSDDGVRWEETAVGAAAGSAATSMSTLRATRSGFVASTGNSSPILLSPDGRAWRQIAVLPPDQHDQFLRFAVAGDLVVGMVDMGGSIPEAIWIGSLAAMGG